VDELVRAAQMRPMDDGRLRGMLIELVPDFLVGNGVTPPNVVSIELKRTGQTIA
jgi:hypothetical protein